jgi:hypothetical protein
MRRSTRVPANTSEGKATRKAGFNVLEPNGKLNGTSGNVAIATVVPRS